MTRINRLTAFKPVSPAGRITDRNGLFYVWDSDKVRFNLPPGSYNIQGVIQPLRQPIHYCEAPRVPAYRFAVTGPETGAFALKRENEAVGTVRMSVDFLSAPTPVQEFVYWHEIGHLAGNYEEELADRYALFSMLANGFNPSQVYWAVDILGFSPERQKKIRSFLKRKYARP